MSATATPPHHEAGVVDPIRVPAALVRAWHRFGDLHPLARWFIALAAADAAARAVGAFGYWPGLLGDPIGFALAALPESALILLPAVLVLRREDAIEATPLVVQGAGLLALAVALGRPIQWLVGGLGPTDTLLAWTFVSIAGSVVLAIGWAVFGRGLTALSRRSPTQYVTGLGNLVLVGIALPAAMGLLTALLGPGTNLGDPGLDEQARMTAVVAFAPAFARAYAARAIVRGLGDPLRPEVATSLAAVAMLLSALLELAIWGLQGLAAVGSPLAQSIFSSPQVMAVEWLVRGSLIALVVACFLGLADRAGPSRPVPPVRPPEPPPGPSWPPRPQEP